MMNAIYSLANLAKILSHPHAGHSHNLTRFCPRLVWALEHGQGIGELKKIWYFTNQSIFMTAEMISWSSHASKLKAELESDGISDILSHVTMFCHERCITFISPPPILTTNLPPSHLPPSHYPLSLFSFFSRLHCFIKNRFFDLIFVFRFELMCCFVTFNE